MSILDAIFEKSQAGKAKSDGTDWAEVLKLLSAGKVSVRAYVCSQDRPSCYFPLRLHRHCPSLHRFFVITLPSSLLRYPCLPPRLVTMGVQEGRLLSWSPYRGRSDQYEGEH